MASHPLGFPLRALQVILVTTLSLYSFLVLVACRSNSSSNSSYFLTDMYVGLSSSWADRDFFISVASN